jgi:phosphate-selective porin OprO/OprP
MRPEIRCGGGRRRRLAVAGLGVGLALWLLGHAEAGAQDAPAPTPPPPAPSTPPPEVARATPPPTTNEELLQELRRLRSEVAEASQLRREVEQLRSEVSTLRAQPSAPAPGAAARSPGQGDGVPDRHHSGAHVPDLPDKPGTDRHLITGHYRYNDQATGPFGGGGYFNFSALDDEITLNFTNQITVDGTFFDRQNMPTIEQGFNVPFARTFVYGNITKDWSYQIGTQGFLGTFNLLDLWMSWHLRDNVTLRVGKGLTPPLFEYYAFSPALEPVITNSPLFQLAAKRPVGFMFNGTLLDKRLWWWSGVTNSGTSLFGNLDRNVDYNGAVDVTPFRGKDWEGSIWEGLGGGIGFSAGWQQYALNQSSIAVTNNGEATTNPSYTTVVGIPFYVYNDNVNAFGQRTRVAPHLYWFGRFSVLAEYMNHSRVLTDGDTIGRSTQRGYYINMSYWLTGERDFVGNGFQGYSTVEPLRPFIPSRGRYGPGAWQVAAQWSEFNAGLGDVARGFVNTDVSTNRMDNLMVGLNWWPNKYTRLSCDYVWTWFNNPIPITGPDPIDRYNTFWIRFAMFL